MLYISLLMLIFDKSILKKYIYIAKTYEILEVLDPQINTYIRMNKIIRTNLFHKNLVNIYNIKRVIKFNNNFYF